MNIKTAEEILDEYQIHLDKSLWNSQDVEIPVVELMKEYAAQFIDLAVKEAKINEIQTGIGSFRQIDKESILKIKEQIK